jgi:hypothetical protein
MQTDTLICPVSREVMRTQGANKLPRKQDKAVTYPKKNLKKEKRNVNR